MNAFKKIILTTAVISTLGLGGLAASASIKNSQNSQTHSVLAQRAKNTQIAEASDGDGEMNDAVEAELERKTQPENPSTRVNDVNKTQEVSKDQDRKNETQEISDEPNDTDGGNETQETH